MCDCDGERLSVVTRALAASHKRNERRALRPVVAGSMQFNSRKRGRFHPGWFFRIVNRRLGFGMWTRRDTARGRASRRPLFDRFSPSLIVHNIIVMVLYKVFSISFQSSLDRFSPTGGAPSSRSRMPSSSFFSSLPYPPRPAS